MLLSSPDDNPSPGSAVILEEQGDPRGGNVSESPPTSLTLTTPFIILLLAFGSLVSIVTILLLLIIWISTRSFFHFSTPRFFDAFWGILCFGAFLVCLVGSCCGMWNCFRGYSIQFENDSGDIIHEGGGIVRIQTWVVIWSFLCCGDWSGRNSQRPRKCLLTDIRIPYVRTERIYATCRQTLWIRVRRAQILHRDTTFYRTEGWSERGGDFFLFVRCPAAMAAVVNRIRVHMSQVVPPARLAEIFPNAADGFLGPYWLEEDERPLLLASEASEPEAEDLEENGETNQ